MMSIQSAIRLAFLTAAMTLWNLPVAADELPKKAEKLSAEESAKFFDTQIRPILQVHCFNCHGGEAKIKGELRLTSREAILKGGQTGPAVSLDKPKESLLLQALAYDELRMPPKGKLPQSQIDLLTRWVELGIPWGVETAAKAKGGGHAMNQINETTKNFWSFRPVQRPALPAVSNPAWVANPIDAFVLAKLDANRLTPAPTASKATLIRRLYYDFLGLPPTPEQVEAFVNDARPEAYEQLVDKLLASPHYGERWARRWLDLVRYAETNSFERDDPKPFVWRYRDYVIQALNSDKPYDQFVREQLAGDELPGGKPECLIATGYYRLGLWDDEPSDPLQAKYDELDDIVSTTSQVFLGITVGCARCHDHKIDPVPQKDYYGFLSFFHGIRSYGVRSADSVAAASLRPVAVERTAEEKRQFAEQSAKYKKRLAFVENQLDEIEALVKPDFAEVEKEEFRHEQHKVPLVKKRVPKIVSPERFDKYVKLSGERDRLRKNPPADMAQALCVTEVGRDAPATHVLLRGNPNVKGDPVEPRFLSILSPPSPRVESLPPECKTSGRRLALAKWIASPDNPLTARVMVNRIWQGHFGRGLVRSTSNFGTAGTPPTHPELLDWLAGEFVRTGWRLKPLHKQIVMSNSYRMSSQTNPGALAKDPENDLLWRFDMRRLDAEEIRDSILAANGTLNLKTVGGQSMYPVMPPEILAGQSRPGYGWHKSSPEEMARRSLYVHSKRSLQLPILASFDAPDTDFTCPVRFATTQPTQALGLLNSVFATEQAQAFADFAKKSAGPSEAEQVRFILRRTTQREPIPAEIERGVQFLQRLRQEHSLAESDALRSFCLLALNLNEFVYLD